jgi:hypothetical protein
MFVRLFVWMFAACLVLLWPAMAPAHEAKGPHGGLMTDAGPYHVELIAKENQLRVFVFDDKTSPVQTKDASATATVLLGQEKQTVTLKPGTPGTDDNSLAGQFAMNAGSGLRIVVLIQLPGKPSVVARFAF